MLEMQNMQLPSVNDGWHWAVWIVLVAVVSVLTVLVLVFRGVVIPYWREKTKLEIDRERQRLDAEMRATEANLALVQRAVEFLETSKSAKDQVREAVLELIARQAELRAVVDELATIAASQSEEMAHLIKAHEDPGAGKLFETWTLKRAIVVVVEAWLKHRAEHPEKFVEAVAEAKRIVEEGL